MLWACIVLPQLALDAVLRRLPDPACRWRWPADPRNLRTLHAVNAGAAQAGLRAGMRLAAAQLLPTLATVEHDPRAESRWQRFLAAWAYRHSSAVSAQGRLHAGSARQLPPAPAVAAASSAVARGTERTRLRPPHGDGTHAARAARVLAGCRTA